MKKRFELLVNPIACDGHGICAELFPERVSLDEWGYPIIDGHAIPEELEKHARRAVAECPKLALTMVAPSGAAAHNPREPIRGRTDDSGGARRR